MSALLALIAAPEGAQADYYLRGIDYDTGNLYAIDPENVNAGFVNMDLVGATGVTGMADIVYNSNDGMLYGYSTGMDAKLYRIDPETAATTQIGPLNLGFVFEGAMCFGPGGALYGANQGEAEVPNFFTLNMTTGAGTIVNTVGGFAHDLNGMVMRDDGKFASFDRETNNLLIFNPANGFISDQLGTGLIAGEVGGMTRHYSRTFLSTSGPISAFPSTNSLYKVNLATGGTTLVGGFQPWLISDTGISGIAAVPEPTTCIAIGAGLLAFNRRRKQGRMQ